MKKNLSEIVEIKNHERFKKNIFSEVGSRNLVGYLYVRLVFVFR